MSYVVDYSVRYYISYVVDYSVSYIILAM